MARVLISREMRLRSFDAATQSIRTYLWLYPVFIHTVSFVNYAYAYVTNLGFRRAFGVLYTSPALSQIYTTKRNLSRRKIMKARLYRCPWRLRALATPNPPALPHAAARPSLRVLSPRSRPASGLTLLLVHTHLDDSIANFRRERNNIESHEWYPKYTRASL